LDTNSQAVDAKTVAAALAQGLGVSIEVFAVADPTVKGGKAIYRVKICSDKDIDPKAVGDALHGAITGGKGSTDFPGVKITDSYEGSVDPSVESCASALHSFWF
jgi:hypothetical protein